jgi:hypothetical protein
MNGRARASDNPAVPLALALGLIVGVMVLAGCGSGSGSTSSVGSGAGGRRTQVGADLSSCKRAARAIESTEIAHIEAGLKSGELGASTAAALKKGSAERESAAIERCRKPG